MAIVKIVLKIITSLLFVALLTVLATSISVVYNFQPPKPFSGKNIFNPYRNFDKTQPWKRANFHTHTRVEGLLNECDYTPEQAVEYYEEFNYDIVTISNHNALTAHPTDSSHSHTLYEHGYNLFKFHKLVFGSGAVNRFDHLLPLFAFQKQWQLDMLAATADIVVLNHPYRTHTISKQQMERLTGYDIVELDSGKGTENEYWDWALSAGRYSFAIANDDLHHPERTSAIAARSNFLCTPSESYDDICRILSEGCYYAMRTPDYGAGNRDVKIVKNRTIPYIKNIGTANDAVFITLSESADSIKITGQDHATLAVHYGVDSVGYTMKATDPYSRFTAYFAEGEVIYTNPFARYDASVTPMPTAADTHSRSIPLTILYNLALALLFVGVSTLFYKTIIW